MPSTKEARIRYRQSQYGKAMRSVQKKRAFMKIKLRAYNIISHEYIKCVKCGCYDIRLLEINHKNGGGRKEYSNRPSRMDFYRAIAKGKRDSDDLELTCRVCNARHYLELVHGKLPYTIQWHGKTSHTQQLSLDICGEN